MKLIKLAACASVFAPIMALSQQALADNPHCGSSASHWNVPDGALVVSKAGGGMVGRIISALGEDNGHSMISHGVWNGMSHATRSEDTVQSLADSGSTWDLVTDLCSTPIVADSLHYGWPGTERIQTPAAYAFTENNDPAQMKAPDLSYYETVSWDTHSVSVPGECKNPRYAGEIDLNDGYGTRPGHIECDAIPGCPNPSYNAGDLHVSCDAIPNCSDFPKVINNIVTCDAGKSGCANGGHLETHAAIVWRPGSPTKTTTLVCTPNTIGKVCQAWANNRDVFGHITGPAECIKWGLGVTYNPEVTARNNAWSAAPPFQNMSYGGYGIARTATPDGKGVTAFLMGHQTVQEQSDTNGNQAYARYADSNEAPNGYYYDFHQFRDSDSCPLGQIGSTHGVVCSTFLAWGQANGTQNNNIRPHLYAGQQVAAAAGALFSAAFDACQAKMGSLNDTQRALAKDRCNGFDPICHAAAWQMVNCFSDGQCGSSSEGLFADTVSGNKTAYSVSPDRLAGVGVHSPIPGQKAAMNGNPEPLNGDPSKSVWASDVQNPVRFDSAVSYACWD